MLNTASPWFLVCCRLLVWLLLPLSICANAAQKQFNERDSKPAVELYNPVPICIGEVNEWAPYTFWARKDGQIDKNQLIGAATQLIEAALDQIGLSYSYNYMPWKRVLHEIEHFGGRGVCELSWDASFKPTRAEVFFYLTPIYRTHLGVFYSTNRFPDGPDLPTAEEINNYQLCGVQGYNYNKFPIKDMSAFDLLSADVNVNMNKLSKRRCDLMPSSIEPIYGGQAIGAFKIPDDIRSARLPGLRKTFYPFVSKSSPRGEWLAARISHAIIKLQETGQAENFFKQFLPDGSGI